MRPMDICRWMTWRKYQVWQQFIPIEIIPIRSAMLCVWMVGVVNRSSDSCKKFSLSPSMYSSTLTHFLSLLRTLTGIRTHTLYIHIYLHSSSSFFSFFLVVNILSLLSILRRFSFSLRNEMNKENHRRLSFSFTFLVPNEIDRAEIILSWIRPISLHWADRNSTSVDTRGDLSFISGKHRSRLDSSPAQARSKEISGMTLFLRIWPRKGLLLRGFVALQSINHWVTNPMCSTCIDQVWEDACGMNGKKTPHFPQINTGSALLNLRNATTSDSICQAYRHVHGKRKNWRNQRLSTFHWHTPYLCNL